MKKEYDYLMDIQENVLDLISNTNMELVDCISNKSTLYSTLLKETIIDKEQIILMKDYNENFQIIPPHNHCFYEILLIRSGNIKFEIEDQIYMTQPGDIILLPPLMTHQPLFPKKMLCPYDRTIIWIDDKFWKHELEKNYDLNYVFEWCSRENHYLWRTSPTTSKAILGIAETIYKLCADKPHGWRTLQRYSCMSLMSIISSLCHGENQLVDHKGDSFVDGILTYINSHLSEKITIENTAKEFMVSKSSISHCFQEKLGVSFYRCVTQHRLLHVQKQLLSDVPVTKAWINSGFFNYSTFYRAFKKEYGVSPSNFVHKIRHNP